MGELQHRGTHCFYHWKEHKVIRCQKCQKPICNECTYLFAREKETPNEQKSKFCPECYLKAVEDKYKPYYFAIIGIFVLMLFFGLITKKSLGAYLIIFFVFFAIMLILIFIVVLSRELNNARKACSSARKSLRKYEDTLRKSQLKIGNATSDQTKVVSLLCRFCGAPLTKFSDTCEYCGTSWIWKNE
jgi:hypothetical protein